MIYKLSKWISYHPKTIIIISLLLLIPSVIGYALTNVNYDILTYLPKNIESVQGEKILDKSFNNASSSFLVIDSTDSKYLSRLQSQIEQIDGVYGVMGVSSLVDASIPKEILPDILNSIFYSQDGTSSLMMVQYIDSGSSERTMDAIKEIRSVLNKNSFMSGLSALNVDTMDMANSQAPVYITIAIILALVVLSFTMKTQIH